MRKKKSMFIRIKIIILVLVLAGCNVARSQCYFGNYNFAYNTPGTFTPNYVGGIEFYLPADATVTSLCLWGLGTNAHVQMGLYSDNFDVPDHLITTSSVGTVTSGIVSLPVVPVTLTAGMYWIMGIFDGGGASNDHTQLTTLSGGMVYYSYHAFGAPFPVNCNNFSSYCCQDIHYWAELASVAGTDIQSTCGSYTWIDGNTYITSNNSATHIITGGAANGCDSIVKLDLTITIPDTSVTQISNVLTSHESGCNYQWLDCDNNFSVISGATSQTYTASADGNYAVEVRKNGCVDTSACFSVTDAGITNNDRAAGPVIYSNPVNNTVTIKLPAGNAIVKIYDLMAQCVYQSEITPGENVIDLAKLADGVYVISVMNEHWNFQDKIIKE